ncbi:hypothetical protein [Lactococcus petauri]|uniref:hypothetical protein n=1 Tax=Lactococcus petauri TaxID=1940789 RepID=UPI002551AD1A|nr:hypothetical protein [Lactococcus petauri]
MDEQTEVWRSQKELRRDTVRGVMNAIRYYHNFVEGKKREEELKKQTKDQKAREEFQKNLKTPGEKSYDFMLESGRSIDYHSLDDNVDIDKLKQYLNGEKLQYCIRTSALDGKKEIVYFSKDTPRVKAAIAKSLEEILKDSSKEKAQEFVNETKQLGFSPTDDVDPATFYKDDIIYQGTSKHRLESEGYGLPSLQGRGLEVKSFPLDDEISHQKVEEFMKGYDITVTFADNREGKTQMYLLLRTDKLEEQRQSLKDAFTELQHNPQKIRQVRPTMKNQMQKAKAKTAENLKKAKEQKLQKGAKDLQKDIRKGLSK